MEYKNCSLCGRMKPITDYHTGNAYAKGRMVRCKVCHAKKQRRKNPMFRATHDTQVIVCVHEGLNEDAKLCPKCKRYVDKQSYYKQQVWESVDGDGLFAKCKGCCLVNVSNMAPDEQHYRNYIREE